MSDVQIDTTPVPNMDMHRLIIRRKMAELKERLKNTDKVLDDTLMTLKYANIKLTDDQTEAANLDQEDVEKEEKAQAKAESQKSSIQQPRKWSVATLYL